MVLRAVLTPALVLAALAAAGTGAALRPVERFTTSDGPRVDPNFNINCGGPANERFLQDDFGWIKGNTSNFAKPDALIGGAETKNRFMYRSHRYGTGAPEWGYDVPVKVPGTYGCTVHFAETSSNAFANGARVFDLTITAKGAPVVFRNIDVFKALRGAEFTVYTKTEENLVVTNGISFRVRKLPTSRHPAFMSGITCERTGDLPAGMAPEIPIPTPGPNDPTFARMDTGAPQGTPLTGQEININAGYGSIGRFTGENSEWLAFGPSTTFDIENQTIGGAEPKNAPALWSHRFGQEGDFGFIIPVNSPGVWECSLHWAEIASSVRIGARIFDAQVQDKLFSDIDVLKETGNAYFTSFVKTYVNVPIADALVVRLGRKAGNPMLSAITCAKTYNTTYTIAKGMLAMRSRQIEVSPEPVTTPGAEVQIVLPPVVPEPSPRPSPTTDTVPPPSSEVLLPSPAQTLDPSPSPIDATALPTLTAAEATSLLTDVALDPVPNVSDSEVRQAINLAVTLPQGTQVDNRFKDVMKNISALGSLTNSSIWAMTNISVSSSSLAPRAATTVKTTLDVDMMAPLFTGTGLESVQSLTRYIQGPDATTKLQESYAGSDVKLRQTPETSAYAVAEKAQATARSTVVAAVVGTLLGVLLIAALIAFMVILRHRRNEVNDPAAFDAPPPAMDSDAEAQSSTARSEAAASVDYLDDDSTFTAATSRAGDPEAGVTLDKDVWGRGSS